MKITDAFNWSYCTITTVLKTELGVSSNKSHFYVPGVYYNNFLSFCYMNTTLKLPWYNVLIFKKPF